ncbi:MAG: YicC/YloC family endoribonuclease [Pseudomonadales bacterium]|jgi:uncharacterized protein (TIGR00255 family)|nr:YicC/YloC family endoribonuclease [Pseudomonadales bacterium]
MIHSMTAFARGESAGSQGHMAIEIRSVNHRYLDASLRLPEQLRPYEAALREALRARIERGKVELSARFSAVGGQAALEVDEARAAAVAEAAREMAARLGDRAGSIDPLELLRWPGVLLDTELDGDVLGSELADLTESVLTAFIAHRAREGARLARIVESRLVAIEEIVATVRARADELVSALRGRLLARTAELAAELEPQRLEQEVALLAQKADVAEELDRLDVHVAEIRRTLAGDGPAGRRLDFLAQELNREANTLASKASAADVALRAVDLKVLVEQIREQIQNVE